MHTDNLKLMTEEEIRKIINDTFDENIMNNLDSSIIFKYIEGLEKENQELKKQLEECYCNRTDCSSRIKDSKQYDSLVQKTEKQQKEFIEYLEDEIYTIEPKGTLINFNCDYDSEEDYIRGVEKRVELDTLKNNLSKYKEIIGGKE